MRIFLACLGTETNSFSPLPTGMGAFSETMLCHGDGSSNGRHMIVEPLRLWRREATEAGHEVIESLSAFAEPGGNTSRPTHEALRDEILRDLEQAGDVDVILVSLHGAMIADGCLDVEGDLLRRIRQTVGDRTIIGVILDLHCQLTDEMVDNATFIITYKEYPHVDIVERAREAFAIALAAAEGIYEPVMVHRKCGINAYMPTTVEPMRGFVRSMTEIEGSSGILSVSLAHGFPHGDCPGVGAGVLIVANKSDRKHAEKVAEQLSERLWDIRKSVSPQYLSIDEALDEALASNKFPIVIADTSDNPGCGAAADSTFFLERMIERGIENAISAIYWDPIAVRMCEEAGEGAHISLRLGGKCGPLSGRPLDLQVTIKRIQPNAWQTFNGFPAQMGTVVWLRSGGIDILVNDKRFQVGAPDLMSNVGLDPHSRKIIVVKSTQHFHAGFAPMAGKILYAAPPGTSNPKTRLITYSNTIPPKWSAP